jgi:hypothetical protein
LASVQTVKHELFLRRHETLDSQQNSKKTNISQEAVKNNNTQDGKIILPESHKYFG